MSRRLSVGVWGALLLAGMAGACPAPAVAEKECPRESLERLPVRVLVPPRFEADAAWFARGAAGYSLDVWARVADDDLQFVRRDDRFLARYEVTVLVHDDHGKRVTGDQVRRSRWVDTYEETGRSEGAPTDLVRLTVDEPGDYDVIVRVRDIDSASESEGQQKVHIPEAGDGLWFSGLVFLEGGGSAGEPFEPGALPVSIARSYGDSLPVVRAYVELYGPEAERRAAEVRALVHLEDENRTETGEARRLEVSAPSSPGEAFAVDMPTDSLGVGAYDLRLEAWEGGKARAVMCGKFRVLSSAAMWWRDFDEMLDLLSYIGTKEELERLKQAPPGERKEAWDEFWAAKDRSPQTARNETRDEFFERAEYANRNFGTMLVKGWQTDRGRIYITEGPPDSIESQPMDLSGKPWEAWYYQERGLIYIFVDRNGFGDYQLVEVRS